MIKMSQLASRERDRLFTSWRDVRTGRITYRYTQHHTEYIQSSFQKQLMSFASSVLLLSCSSCCVAFAGVRGVDLGGGAQEVRKIEN
jgi:hypothetical protein